MLTAPCRFATTTNIPFSGTLTQDGITAEGGDRVLVKNQTNAQENGIYVVGPSPSFSLVRASDLVGTHDADQRIFIPVDEGLLQGETLWRVANAGTIVVGTSLLTFERGEVSVKDFGAVGDGLSDDRVAIQAAISSHARSIYFPEGIYSISDAIDLPSRGQGVLHLFGAGLAETVLKSSRPFGAMFRIGSPTEYTTFGTIEDMKLSSAGEVDYGIHCTRVDHFTFRRVWCTGFRKAGISIVYGWCNDFIDSEFSENAGHGLKLNTESNENTPDSFSGGNNAVNIRNCKIFANGKHGIYARSGHGLWIDGCTIEQNAAGGILLANFDGFSISSYFERNAATGYDFATPPRTIKADIILCGAGTDTVMSSAYPCRGGVISGCPVSSTASGDVRAYSTAFVYDAGAVECSVRDCVLSPETLPPFALIAWEYTPGFRGYDWTVESCGSFTKIIDELNVAAQSNSWSARTRIVAPFLIWKTTATSIVESVAKTAQGRNYASVDLNRWVQLDAGLASTYQRAEARPPQRMHFWNGLPIWSIKSTAPGKSYTYGMRLAARDYRDLKDKLMWFGIWKYAPDATRAYAQPFCNKQEFSSAAGHSSAEWIFEAVSFLWPSSGQVECGIYKDGEQTGDIYFTAPMLMEVGTPMTEALQTIPLMPYTWRGREVPTGGRWLRGDTVLNVAPRDGGAPGWVCTEDGTPGTWKAMANLAD